MMVGLAAEHGEKKNVMIDATYLKAHCTASNLGVKKGGARSPDRTDQGWHEHETACHLRQPGTPSQAVRNGRAGQRLHRCAGADSLPDVDWLLGDRGYDADWFRETLEDKGIRACIPGRKQRKTPVKYDKRRYKRRNRIEIMFGRLKDWRRVATRYDRCPKVFLSAIALAATVIYWL
ncbi:IS5 family transposase [Frigidibacter sp. ROC022]|uniref:IS5 family transposase n=1 Tax=Frigidibacter sp. ROC022 TaxID=2971796 RepID=UPI00215A3C0E|nr:IS5 family transposase [Frigidibacter sp. ROC022]MCR8724516.1 IS5 family transposase [Frigidibacter sp. ROC022]